jgi:hypothetical protein
MPNRRFTDRQLKLAILRAYSDLPVGQHHHMVNVIGRGVGAARGYVERHLAVEFSPEERARAARLYQHLVAEGLLGSSFHDPSDYLSWCAITDAGRQALQRGLLDDLDHALAKINPVLVEMRDGAWARLRSELPDGPRQAASSAREMVQQTLKDGVTDDEVRAQPWFQDSEAGITRRDRARCLLERSRAPIPEDERELIEGDLASLLATVNSLHAIAHGRRQASTQRVEDLLRAAEMGLRAILLGDE